MSSRGQDTADLRADSVSGDRAALRRLLRGLEDHLGRTEANAASALRSLEASIADAHALESGASDIPVLRELTASVLQEQRGAAYGLKHLADELGVMAAALEQRLSRANDDRTVALRAMARNVRARADELDARLREAEAHAERALSTFVARLGSWEAASATRERRIAEVFAEQLEASDARRDRDIADLLRSMERGLRSPAATAHAAPSRAAPATQRSSRSAALLLSAGVACLGLVTLAVVLEPPFDLTTPLAPTQAAQAALRGPILIAPPRFAQEGELAVAEPGGRAGATAPDVAKALTSVFAAVEAGRPGAIERLRSLADAGLPRAQMYLAKVYETGRAGIAVDPAAARRWTARAADAGDPVAMHNLALYYLQGRGGPRDDALAARLMKRAAAAGLADSQFNLGLLYETGAGVERNLVEAYKWFQIAANSGDLKARARAVALEDRLSAKELVVAERVAYRFTPGARSLEETVLAPGADTIAESQKKLARLGFYIGPTDGQETPAYRQAVEAYRHSQSAQAASVTPAPR